MIKSNIKILTSNFLAQTNALLVGNKKSGNEIQKNIDGNKPSIQWHQQINSS